jgi:hypothetical protein
MWSISRSQTLIVVTRYPNCTILSMRSQANSFQGIKHADVNSSRETISVFSNSTQHKHDLLAGESRMVFSFITASDALLHLRDVQSDMALHLHVLFPCALDFVLDLFFEISHLV